MGEWPVRAPLGRAKLCRICASGICWLPSQSGTTVAQFECADPSATLTNTTLDDRSPEIRFEGAWTQQTGPNFHDQTSTYTSGPGNALTLNFSGELNTPDLS